MELLSPKIVIERSRRTPYKQRPYEIYLDGKKIGVIPFGKTVVFDASAGLHALQIKIDWIGSEQVRFDVKAGDVKTFTASGFGNGNWIIPVGGVLALVGLALRWWFDWQGFIWLAWPFMLAMLFYFTFGRQRHLRLIEKL